MEFKNFVIFNCVVCIYINEINDTTVMNYYTSKLNYYLQIIKNPRSKRFKCVMRA